MPIEPTTPSSEPAPGRTVAAATAARRRKRTPTRFTPNAPDITIAFAFIPFGVLAVVFGPMVVPGLRTIFSPLVIVSLIAAMIAVVFIFAARHGRLVKRIASSDGFHCLNCHYDLHGLPDVGACPECAEDYNRTDLERRWNMWVQSQTKDQRSVQPRFGSEEASKPPLPRARAPRGVLLIVLPTVMLIPTFMLTMAAWRSDLFPEWIPLSLGAFLIAFASFNARRVLRFLDHVRRSDCLLCLRCHADLRPLTSEEGSCPACSAPYRKLQVRERWRSVLGDGLFHSGA